MKNNRAGLNKVNLKKLIKFLKEREKDIIKPKEEETKNKN
jgi:hypothetical protein